MVDDAPLLDSGDGDRSADEAPAAEESPEIVLGRVMESQQDIFKGQIQELHQLVNTHKLRTGQDPLAVTIVAPPGPVPGAVPVVPGAVPVVPGAVPYRPAPGAVPYHPMVGAVPYAGPQTLVPLQSMPMRPAQAPAPPAPAPRKSTPRLNNQQKEMLTKSFQLNENPSPAELREIVSTLGIEESLVVNFYNTLRKKKKENAEAAEAVAAKEGKEIEEGLSKLGLSPGGGIASVASMEQLAALLERAVASGVKSETLSLLATVLLETKAPHLLRHFMGRGGLKSVSGAMQVVKQQNRTLTLRTFMKVLQHLPVDVQALQASDVGKAVNRLKTHPDADVSARAAALVESWKKMVAAAPPPAPAPPAPKTSPTPASKPAPSQDDPKKRPRPTIDTAPAAGDPAGPEEAAAKRVKTDEAASPKGDESPAGAPARPLPSPRAPPSRPHRPPPGPRAAPAPAPAPAAAAASLEDADIFGGKQAALPARIPRKAGPPSLKPDYVRMREEKKRVRPGVVGLEADPMLEESRAKAAAARLARQQPTSVDDVKKAKQLQRILGDSGPPAAGAGAGPSGAGSSGKKRVSWPPEEKLVRRHIFVVEEPEAEAEAAAAGDAPRFDHANFATGFKEEKKHERELLALEKQRHEEEERRRHAMAPSILWRMPAGAPPPPRPAPPRTPSSRRPQ
eukprot:tig00001215_g7566.t1